MRATVSASALAGALKSSAAARTTTMPVLTHALLQADTDSLTLETTDTEIYVRVSIDAQVSSPGSALLHAGLLSAASAADGDIAISGEGDVRRGRSRYSVPVLPAGDFPTAEVVQFTPVVIDPLQLREAIAQVQYAAKPDDVRAFCQTVNLQTGRVWATDGHRAARVAVDYDGPTVCIPVRQIAHVLGALEEGARVLVAKSGAASEVNVSAPQRAGLLRIERKGVTVTVRCYDTTLPSVDQLFPVHPRDPIVVERKLLAAALRRFMPFISEKIGAVVRLSVHEGELGLSDRKRENMDTVPLSAASTPGAEIDMGANAKYLLDVLSVIDGDLVALHPPTAAGPLVLMEHNGDIDRAGHIAMPWNI